MLNPNVQRKQGAMGSEYEQNLSDYVVIYFDMHNMMKISRILNFIREK